MAMYQDLDSWDPRRDDFEDRNFNSYVNGPARNLIGTRQHGTSRQKNTSLYVTGIPLELTEGGLLNLFARSGKVVHTKICKPTPGKERSSRDTYGFVKMESIGDAERAIRDMNLFQLEGFQFKVKMALSEEERARRKEDQLQMQSMYFNNDESDSDDKQLFQSNFKENQPQPMMNGHSTQLGPKVGKGRGQALSEITGLSGSFGSEPQQASPRDRGGGMVPAGRGGANMMVNEVGKPGRVLLPTPSPRPPMENLSITVDHDNHRNLARSREPITLESLNRGAEPYPPGPANHRQMGRGDYSRGHDTGISDGRLNQTYGGPMGGMSPHPGPYGAAAPDMYASYAAGPLGYGSDPRQPGSYPRQQAAHQPGSYPNHQQPYPNHQQPLHSMLQPFNHSLLQTVPPPVTPLNSTFVTEPPKPQAIKKKMEPKVEKKMECTYCGKLGRNMCKNCKSPYCSKDCQAADWSKHKNICNSISKEKDVADAFEEKFDVSVGDELIPKVKTLMERATGEEVKVTKKEQKSDANAKPRNHNNKGEGQSRSSNNSNQRGKGGDKNDRGGRQDRGGYETDVDRRSKGSNDRDGTGYETDTGRGKRACFNCGATDHVRQDCPKPHGAYTECYNCHKIGHMSRECPLKQGQNSQPSRSNRSKSPDGKSRSKTNDDWDDDKPKSKMAREPVAPLAHSTPVDAEKTRVPAQSKMDTPVRPQDKGQGARPGTISIPNSELALNKEVMVVVTDPVSVNEIWLQDIEQTLPLQDIMMAMGLKFSQCPCDVTLNSLKVGDYYGAKFIDGAWYRVCIKNVSGQGDVKVHYIDFGNTEVTKVDNLRQLETSMKEQSAKAILCSIDGIDVAASSSVDPALIKKHVIADVPYHVVCKGVSSGPDRKIYKLCSMTNEKGVDVLKALLSEIKSTPGSSVQASIVLMKDIPHIVSRLQIGQKYLALFSYVESSNQFTVQIHDTDKPNDFEEFDNKLQEFYNKQAHEPYRPTKQEEIIISKYSEDKKWYRAKVVDIRDNEVDVVFIDFGNSEVTRFESCRKITPEFTKFERKIVPCRLHNVTVPAECPQEIVMLYQHFLSHKVMVKLMEVRNNVHSVELYSTEGQSYSDEFRALLNQTEKPVETVQPTSTDKPKDDGVKAGASPVKEAAGAIPFGELKLNTEIQVMPTDIVSLRFFHIKIASPELDSQLASLMLELNQVCAGAKPYNAGVDEFVAAQFFDGEETLWYRGQVLQVSGDTYTVLYVDYGNMSAVKKEAITKLEPSLCTLPTMAIPCALKGAEAVNDDQMLLNSFKNVLNTLATVKAVNCEQGIYDVEMCLPGGVNLNNMLMNAISEMEDSGQSAAKAKPAESVPTQEEMVVSTKVQQETSTPHTVKTLDTTSPVSTGTHKKQTDNFSRLKKMPLSEDVPTPVMTVHINSLSSFYVQISDSESVEALLEMMKDLNDYCNKESSPYTCQVMEYVAALFGDPASQCWYRAEVLRLDGNSAEVIFLDYGNKDRIKMTDIRRLTDRFLELPIMAVHCSLAGSDGSEPEASTEEFHSILNHKVNVNVVKNLKDAYSVEMILNNPEKTVVNTLFGLDPSKVNNPSQAVTTPTPDANTGNSPETHTSASKELEPTSSARSSQASAIDQPLPKPPVSVFEIGTPLCGAAMSIDSVQCFYIMLGDMTVQRLLGELMTELNNHCKEVGANYTPSLGEYVAAFYSENGTDELWYRGVITGVCGSGQFKVHYIDYGNSAVVETKHIKRLDKQFLELPAFVTCCKLSGCEHISEEGARQFKAYEGVAVTIQAEREVNGVYEVQMLNQDNKNVKHLICGTQNTTGTIPKTTVTTAASTELVDQLPRPKTPVSQDALPRKSASPQMAERTVVFSQTVAKSRPKGKEFEVVITSPQRPNLFHCQLKDQSNIVALKFLSDSMKIDCEQGSYNGKGSKFEVGELCCAKFIDGEWYRATILDVFPDDTVSVEYVDFGNRSEVSVEQLRPIRPEYTELALLAFRCSLHGVIPTGSSWCDKAVIELSKFSDKCLSAKLINNGNDVYELDLTDESGVNVAQHLIEAGVAKKQEEQVVDDREMMRRENELLRRQLEQMQSQFATLMKMNQAT